MSAPLHPLFKYATATLAGVCAIIVARHEVYSATSKEDTYMKKSYYNYGDPVVEHSREDISRKLRERELELKK